MQNIKNPDTHTEYHKIQNCLSVLQYQGVNINNIVH